MKCIKIPVLAVFCIFALLAGIPGPAHAASGSPGGSLFEASVPVADQSAAAREEALRNALEAVLVRITGDPLVASSSAATPLLENAVHYAGAYRYEEYVPAVVETQKDTATAEPVLHLTASFDAAALERAARQAGLPYWGQERPETLVWLAIEDGRTLVGDANTGIGAKAHDALQRAARVRGIDLVFPLLDTQDRQKVSYTDIWAGFDDRILAASERYGANTVLVGKLYRVSNGWQAKWHLLAKAGENFSQWQSLSGPLASVIMGGINPLADAYAARYASHSIDGAQQTDVVELAITGVQTLKAYGAVLDYVQDLTPVHRVQVARVAKNELTLQLQLNSSVAQLERAIDLGRLLTPAPAQTAPVFSPPENSQPMGDTDTGQTPESSAPETPAENSAPKGVQDTLPGTQPHPAMPTPRTVLRYQYHS